MSKIAPSERNIYGCLPCPKCGSAYRYTLVERKSGAGVIVCDDCGRRAHWDKTWGRNGAVDETETKTRARAAKGGR